MLTFVVACATACPAFSDGIELGLPSLADLPPQLYLDEFEGGLYPAGSNEIPPDHLAVGLSRTAQILPRDVDGNPDPNGWVVLVALGASGGTHMFGAFERLEDISVDRNARLIMVNCAYAALGTGVHDPDSLFWPLLDARIEDLGLSTKQLQVVWMIKKAGPAGEIAVFPDLAIVVRDRYEITTHILHDRYENVQAFFITSVYFGGYVAAGSSEPTWFEEGFGLKWLIEDQINGEEDLNPDPAIGPVMAPWLAWGPYLWADGIAPNLFGLSWHFEDFESDGIHPSPDGESKAAEALRAFLTTSEAAAPWYTRQLGATVSHVSASADAYVRASQPDTNFGTAGILRIESGDAITFAKFDVSSVTKPILRAKFSARVHTTTPSPAAKVFVIDDVSWMENTLTFNNAPSDGVLVGDVESASRDGAVSFDLTEVVKQDSDGAFTVAVVASGGGIVPGAPANGGWKSSETDDGPRLVLTLHTPPADLDEDGLLELDDVAQFVQCLTGPTAPVLPGCTPADADSDGDVDILDYALAVTFFGPID